MTRVPARHPKTRVARAGAAPALRRPRALDIEVVNGDLLFVRQPLMLGHYSSLRLTGTERVVDGLLGGAMTAALGAGLYPNAPGEHQIFVNTGVNRDNPLQLPRPQAAVVVGLGGEGKLRAAEFVAAVRQAVIAWSQRLTESTRGVPPMFELASTLIGSGGVGIGVGQAALLIAQGVHAANEHLRPVGWPCVRSLHFVEIYRDRATEVLLALRAQAKGSPDAYVVAETLRTGPGALPRVLDSGYRGADYDFISALTGESSGNEASIVYTLDTRRARTEVRAQSAQTPLLRNLVATASDDRVVDALIGRTLYELLVPLELGPYLGGSTDTALEVDSGTAGIPWELVDSGKGSASDPRPWAIRAKLLRKLRIEDFATRAPDADADASALVIGEPACDLALYPRLPGARAEAIAVAESLASANALGIDRVVSLVSDDEDGAGADARTVVAALLGRDWRIVHIAGHGAPPTAVAAPRKSSVDATRTIGDTRGVVLSDGTFLGPREIGNMRAVPELVFVNCCHLGARSAAQLLTKDGPVSGAPADRPRFAANVAEALIRIGVRCVIAAGWAVDDAAASEFATRFYASLLRGRRFIEAVAEAREGAFAMGGNTWAAYQCYGDPDWRFVRNVSDAQRPMRSLDDEFAGVASTDGLILALETLAVTSIYQRVAVAGQQAKIRHLEERFASRWAGTGAVAEAFGRACDAVGDRAAAIRWYARAVRTNDGTASLKAIEQLGNLRVRQAWESAERALRAAARSAAGRGSVPKRASNKPAKGVPSRAGNVLRAALDRARDDIAAALVLLGQTTALQPTLERHSLTGSAWKRLAMVEAAASNPRAEAAAIDQMKSHYGRALEIARETRDDLMFYPGLNRMAAELVADAGNPRWRNFDRHALAAVRASLLAKARDDPDFWSVAGLTELRIYVAIAKRKLSAELDVVLGEFDDLHRRVNAPSQWASVIDQLRFVLPKYAARAAPTEAGAAVALAKHLTKLAVRSTSSFEKDAPCR